METTVKLTVDQVLTPVQHQRMIDRLTKKLDAATPVLNEEALRRIEWHTEMYLAKTGQLPK